MSVRLKFNVLFLTLTALLCRLAFLRLTFLTLPFQNLCPPSYTSCPLFSKNRQTLRTLFSYTHLICN
uniref:Uncharacterized protein n=1 Tax=Phakopsora pachyrhizi TaxID=170000 RepID=A0A0S1MK21_PHAPC